MFHETGPAYTTAQLQQWAALMAIRPPSYGPGGGLTEVHHGPHHVGRGTAEDPLRLAPADVARLDALHDAQRETVEWTLNLAIHDDGILPSPDSIGYANQVVRSRTGFGAPNLVYGSIDPDPPVWTVGTERWRILAVNQLARGDHAVGIVLGAPPAERVARASAPLAVGVAERWVSVPGVQIAATRNTTYTIRVPDAQAGTTDLTVEAATLRDLIAGATDADATAPGTFVLLEDTAAGRWRAGRSAANVLLLAVSATGAPNVAVLADDGPIAGEAAEIPADWDWQIGDLVLRRRDAAEIYGRRGVAGGESSESARELRWTGIPAGTLAVGETTLRALGPALDASGGGAGGQQSPASGAGVHVGDDPPASPEEGALWSDTSAGNALKRYDGAAWVAVATVPELNNAVAGLALTIQGGIEQVIRRATFARAWIRAGTEAAALAGTGAATWTNSGPGTPPTGAHWSLSDVPAGAGHVYELTAQVSPTAGHGTAWTFGTWAALQITATNTQYSVDGSTAWHTARAQADRYERHFIGGAWGPAIPLYAADELVWANLVSTDIYHATTHWLPPIALIDLPARMLFENFNLMRIYMETRVAGGRVVAGDAVVNPDFFLSAPYADRATATPQPEFYWQIRLNAAGLSAITGGLFHGNGPSANGEDAGLTLQWIRPPSPSHAGEAASLRVVYLKNLSTTYRLSIEAI